jgi:hypothetical protein
LNLRNSRCPDWFIYPVVICESLEDFPRFDLGFVLKLPAAVNWPRLTNSSHGACPASCALSLEL